MAIVLVPVTPAPAPAPAPAAGGPFTDDLTPFFSDFAEVVTLTATPVRAIFDAPSEIALGEAVVVAPSLLVPATAVVASGDTAVVRGVSYRVRQVLDEGPDARLRRLILAEVLT